MARNENEVGNIKERVTQLEQRGGYAARGGLSGTIFHTLSCTLSGTLHSFNFIL